MNQVSSKFIEAARGVLKAYGYFVDNLWHVDDVHLMCEQHQFCRLNDEEAMEVFALANRKFDGETGISWPQLEHALRNYLQHKIVLSEEFESSSAA